jgi:hypothetical protein
VGILRLSVGRSGHDMDFGLINARPGCPLLPLSSTERFGLLPARRGYGFSCAYGACDKALRRREKAIAASILLPPKAPRFIAEEGAFEGSRAGPNAPAGPERGVRSRAVARCNRIVSEGYVGGHVCRSGKREPLS